MTRGIGRLASLGVVALTLESASALAADQDIWYLGEHVPESAMDARYTALTWPGAGLEARDWQQVVDVAAAHTRTQFVGLEGSLLSLAAVHGVSPRFGFEALGFYDAFDIADGNGTAALSAGRLAGVPIDIEEPADFTAAHGTVRHYGVGAAAIFSRADDGRSSQFIVGALLERFDVVDLGLDYRVAAGRDTGAVGSVDFDSRASFVTPFVAWQRTRELSRSWSWSPRAMLTLAIPPGDLESRITGPGFVVASPVDGQAIPVGDPFIALGLAFEHRPSGIEIDLGGMLFFALAGERLSHPGVDNARVLHVAWQHRRR